MNFAPRWILLIHQIPPKPAYFRVKIWRHLQKLGATTLKGSIYILPNGDNSRESLQWVLKEILAGGGDGAVCEAEFTGGLSDSQIQDLFNEQRDAGYKELTESTREVSKRVSRKKLSTMEKDELHRNLLRLKKQLAEIIAIDFFGAAGRETAEGHIADIENRLSSLEPGHASVREKIIPKKELQGRTWVTRKGIHVDRMASAWLIRRFIDQKAKFKFVDGKNYSADKRELRFDMFEAEFTHEGDLCTFEVLIKRANLKDRSLDKISEIIHDIDLKDGKYGREETAGFEQLIRGIVSRFDSDEDRLSKASDMLDNIYEIFQNKSK